MRSKVPFFLLLICTLTLVACSEVETNDDPVIGIWSRADFTEAPEGRIAVREEWIFNDAYLGRYHRYEGNVLTVKTDFGWEKEGAVYQIDYPGLDREADRVTLKRNPDSELLLDLQGEVLAQRE